MMTNFRIMLDSKDYPIAYMTGNGEEAVMKHRHTPAEIVIIANYKKLLK